MRTRSALGSVFMRATIRGAWRTGYESDSRNRVGGILTRARPGARSATRPALRIASGASRFQGGHRETPSPKLQGPDPAQPEFPAVAAVAGRKIVSILSGMPALVGRIVPMSRRPCLWDASGSAGTPRPAGQILQAPYPGTQTLGPAPLHTHTVTVFWNLKVGASLEFGSWSLEFRPPIHWKQRRTSCPHLTRGHRTTSGCRRASPLSFRRAGG
jgi:hypothetical protein